MIRSSLPYDEQNFIDIVYRGSSRPRPYVHKVAVNEGM
jgi:hypothetical protein